jgi:hypothetical protein
MESSNKGRFCTSMFNWKGRTFSEITSIIQKNGLPVRGEEDKVMNRNMLLKSLPLKHYRREIVISDQGRVGNYRNSQSIRTDMETPGGTIVRAIFTGCTGNSKSLYFQIEDTKTNKPCSSCDEVFVSSVTNNSSYTKSLSQSNNALRRVRSAGMNRPRFNERLNNRPESYNTASQYLHSRNKTFQQNQFNNLRIENPSNSSENVYASNTIQYCESNSYVPVYYKPSNAKFANQGAVESSSRLVRLKYDTITDAGSMIRKAYGSQTANALSYGGPETGYTIKDKVGYPNKCTPVIKPDGRVVKC